ncbi:hypothetical protein [Sediminibacterium sp.]|uniref:hypothetical protein n=1 Tax=Sediminibacterium sp. TaxID=1917865 RepID=UPI002735692D|nr:hypothetical protein [Sediminibacterium sp.]MDP3567491.1 hypothetical protein [Sediminibacterium sp.]
MIKAFVFTFFIFSVSVSSDLKKVRLHFTQMSKQEASVTSIKELTLTSKEIPATLKRAYYAAAEMASAQYKISPVAKVNVFNSGKKILEATILSDTSNLEIRYIRYTIQENAPAFLGYKKNIQADKLFLIKNVNNVKSTDPELFSSVYAYLLTYGKLSQQEKAFIED